MTFTYAMEPNPFVEEKLMNKEVFRYLPVGQVSKDDTAILQLSSQKESEVKTLLERTFSAFRKDVTAMEKLHAEMWDSIWEGDLRGYRHAWSNLGRRKRVGGLNCITYDWSFWDWNKRVRSEKWSTENSFPFALNLKGELIKEREDQLNELVLSEVNRILKNDGYSFLKVVSGDFEDTHARLRKEGWEEYRVVFSDPLESLYTRLFVANFPVNWKPHTFPIDKKVFVKKVDGIKPREVSKSFYWLDNVDIYNTTECNYRCGHCMAADVMNEGKVQMDEQMLLKLLDDLGGVESVHFAGQGETSLYPNFLNILDRASKKVLEVRLNTNGSFIPTDKEEAKKLFESLPKNTHIFLSIDKYHERQDPDLRQRVELLKEYSKAYGFKVSFNVRVRDKYSDEKNQLTRKYQIQEYPIIVNRVLNQGRGRRIPDTRYVILEKLLYNIANKPSVGILPDGTLITNFIAAYLPKSARPSCGSVGNIGEEDLPTIIKRYEQLIGTIRGHESAMLRSMDAEVGKRYPYAKNN